MPHTMPSPRPPRHALRASCRPRRFHCLLICGFVIAVAIGLGATTSRSVPTVIRTQRLEVVNEAGKIVLAARATKHGGRIEVKNDAGVTLFSAGPGPTDSEPLDLWEQTRRQLQSQRRDLEQQRQSLRALTRQLRGVESRDQPARRSDQSGQELNQLRRDLERHRRDLDMLERRLSHLNRQVNALQRRL